MNTSEFEKIFRDIRTTTQKVSNDIFQQRRAAALKSLTEQGISLEEDKTSVKKGRPKQQLKS